MKKNRIRLIVVKTLTLVIYCVLLMELGVRVSAFVMDRRSREGGPAEGSHLVYCVGDSFTYGVGVKRHEAWPSLLQNLLRQCDGTDYEVVNMAIPGYGSSYALYIADKIKKASDPKTLIILTGWNANNNDFLRWRELSSVETSILSRTNVFLEHSKFYCLLKWLVTHRKDAVETDDIELIPLTGAMDLYSFKAYQEICLYNLNKIAKMCKDHDVPLLVLNYPYRKMPENEYGLEYEYYHLLFGRTPLSHEDYIISERQENEIAIHSVVRYIAERENLDYLDLNVCFQEGNPDSLFQKDLHHPTAPGHEIIARAVYKKLCSKQAKN
jgi:lysophospholipase L1-like esterase